MMTRTSTTFAALALTGATLATPRAARANDRPEIERASQEQASPAPAARPADGTKGKDSGFTPTHYGWQILVVDAATLTATYGALFAEEVTLFGAAFGGYVAGGPIVHAVRGNWGRALGSGAMRFLLPATGLVVGFGGCSWEDNATCHDPILYASIGVATASLIDALFLADDRPSPRRPDSDWQITPSAMAGPRGGSLGFTGTF